jgi:stage II sporulation protein P
LEHGSSHQLVRLLVQQDFPFEAIVLEGIPGYSSPERPRLEQVRNQGLSLGMFLLTGVNLSDTRTFFLSYFTPPPGGPAWIGWAYNPNDPEFEGSISGPNLEPIPQDPGTNPSTPNQPPIAQPSPGNAKAIVGIYHTHNAEGYTGEGAPERREGENGDVVTVGTTLKNALIKKGIPTLQSMEIHDAVDFNHAYSKSIITATALLQDNPSLKLLIDLHRDGLPPNVSKATTKIDGKEVGKVMIVIGQKNPHWKKNVEIAQEMISLGEDKYPGLFDKEIRYASDARYNQHLADGALLFEIGSQLNTLEEANGAAEA